MSAKSSKGRQLKREVQQLRISEGRYTGQKFKVLPWQEEVIDALADHRIVNLSIARGNGKTTLMSAIACSGLLPGGAYYRKRGQIPLVASSLNQARIAYQHIKHFARERMDEDNGGPNKRYPWQTIDNTHHVQITYAPDDTVLRCIGSDAKRAHGMAPHMIICDEPAKWVSGGREMWAALKTSMGKQIDPKVLNIGTFPDTEDHWFAELFANPTPDMRSIKHAAAADDDPFGMEAILRANPSYEHMPELQSAIEEDRQAALEGGQDYHIYRALRLNLGTPEVADKEFIIGIDDWMAVTKEKPALKEGPVFLAIDLGDGFSMTAFAAYWAMTGRLEVHGAFPATPNLHEHGKIDYVGDRYVRMHKRGELRIYPGTATNNQKFLSEMFEKYSEYDIAGISADRYKTKITNQAIVSAQFGKEIEFRGVGRGVDGNADVVAFQMEVREGFLSIYPNLMMDSAIKEAVITRDTNGNAALNKSRHKGRIDALQASIQAVGMGRRWRLPETAKREYNLEDYVV